MSQILGHNFNPVQCTEEILKRLTPTEGSLYFTTDTRKVFLGKNNEMIRMTPSAEVFYGNKAIEYENTGVEPNPIVYFAESEITNGKAIEIGDLILNIGVTGLSDGCFYTVVNIEDGLIQASRLTMRGSGFGGNTGSGPSSGGQVSSFTID